MSNSWGTISFEVPELLTQATGSITSASEWLFSVLDVAIQALEFTKSFVPGSLDPAAPLMQTVVDELKGLLQDLQKLGLYLTGDWGLLSEPESLIGGYQEYERRMIAKLMDRTDRTRPDISNASSVLGFFFYTSVDLTSWHVLVKTVTGLLDYFQQRPVLKSTIPIPEITQILYGAKAASVLDYGSLGETPSGQVPDAARVHWKVATPLRRDPYLPDLSGPPGGFLVTVSTLANGIQVWYDRPQSNQTKKPVEGKDVPAQPREYGQVLIFPGGDPLVLHGGAEMLAGVPAELGYNSGVKNGVLQDGYSRVFGRVDGQKLPIPLEQLQQGALFLLQRTFFVTTSTVKRAWVTGDYSVMLRGIEMPHAAHVEEQTDGTLSLMDDGPADLFYVRIATCDKAISDGGVFQYQFLPSLKSITGQPLEVIAGGDPSGASSVGAFCSPRQVSFPNLNTQDYLSALQTALLVLVLSRPDLKPLDMLKGSMPLQTWENVQANKIITQGVALVRSGLEGAKQLVDVVYDKDITYQVAMSLLDTNPAAFRRDLMSRIQRAVHDLYSRTGPNPTIEAFVVQQTKFLRQATWRTILKAVHPSYVSAWEGSLLPTELLDTTLWGSLQNGSLTAGLARNPVNAVGNENLAREVMSNSQITEDRLPQMQEGVLDQTVGKWSSYVRSEVPATEVDTFLSSCPRGLRQIYEKAIDPETGSILVPPSWNAVLDEAEKEGRVAGSADLSPVFFFGSGQAVPTKVMYCRSLFAKSDSQTLVLESQGGLYEQASLTLRVAAATVRRTNPSGEWSYVRWLDTVPGVEDYLSTAVNWAESLQQSQKTLVDTMTQYIEFLEARLVSLQQFIARINSLLQSVLGYTFQIPKCSALVTVSRGTAGVLADLISAENKPASSPLSYAGGASLVMPFAPNSALLDLITAFWKAESGPPMPSATLGQDPTTIPGVNGIPEVVPDPDEPDVL